MRSKLAKEWLAGVAMLFLLFAPGTLTAQRKKTPPSSAGPALNDRVAVAKSEVAKAAADYKASLEKLLAIQEVDLKSAAETLERRKALPEGIIAKRELDESARLVSQAEARVADTRRQIADADYLITEAQAAEQLARLPKLGAGGYYASDALIRYVGATRWLLSNASQVESFFAAAFKRPLPVSAFGQTPVHERLGFDHHNSMDVAVHPDSEEGQALMNFLRAAGLPFIAFRHAVPGAATGAHIHIGYPSKRVQP
jgi:hypothetical protein